MKVIILGGCGGMGRYAAKMAANFDNIDVFTVADLYEKMQKNLRHRLVLM